MAAEKSKRASPCGVLCSPVELRVKALRRHPTGFEPATREVTRLCTSSRELEAVAEKSERDVPEASTGLRRAFEARRRRIRTMIFFKKYLAPAPATVKV
jgi:hypothetical protein